MPSFFEHYWSIFFFFGFVVVLAFAWQRFNEPSFPNQETLPRTVEPLRYLFLKPAYQKARFAYVTGLLLLYALLVAPGPKIVPALGEFGFKDFPPRGLGAVGCPLLDRRWGWRPAASSGSTSLRNTCDAGCTLGSSYPYGVERTIGVLEDARYEPPQSQLNLVQSPLREKLQEDLRLAPGNAEASLGARDDPDDIAEADGCAVPCIPLQKAAFDPFQEEFEGDILVTYRSLKQDIQALRPAIKSRPTPRRISPCRSTVCSSESTPISVGESDIRRTASVMSIKRSRSSASVSRRPAAAGCSIS